jgi:hypothetical protein
MANPPEPFDRTPVERAYHLIALGVAVGIVSEALRNYHSLMRT